MRDHTFAKVSTQFRSLFCSLVFDPELTLGQVTSTEWIAEVVGERCQNTMLCIDGFHVVKWATDALDTVRRQVWNEARRP